MKNLLNQLSILFAFLIGFLNTHTAGPQIFENRIWTTKILQQEYYAKYIDRKYKQREQRITGSDYEESIMYLGKLKLKNKQTVYILTSFKTIQAALVKHGQSKIIFLDRNKEIIKQYDLSIPEELPYKVSRNILFFHLNNEDPGKIGIFRVKIYNELPKIICVGPDDCYPGQE